MPIRDRLSFCSSRLRLAALALVGLAGTASAQLGPGQVLLVYDSRSSDSKLVAEYYAGSSRVPGGAGGVKGKYPVYVLDLATTGAAVVIISQDLDEIMQIADRIAIIARGRLSPAIPTAAATIEEIGMLMGGVPAAPGAEVTHAY